MVIPKFLLACNPIVPNIDLTYIYSPHYMSLIMVIEENSEIVRLNDTYRAMPQRLYVYDMLEQFRLVVVQNNVIILEPLQIFVCELIAPYLRSLMGHGRYGFANDRGNLPI